MKRARSWLWLLSLAPLALGMARLQFDTEILNLLPADLPAAEGLRIYQQNFANARELILTLEAPAAEAAAHSLAEALRAGTNLVADVVWQPAWRDDPAQGVELPAYLWLNQPPALFGELTRRLAPTNLAHTLEETRERLATSFSPDDLALGGGSTS